MLFVSFIAVWAACYTSGPVQLESMQGAHLAVSRSIAANPAQLMASYISTFLVKMDYYVRKPRKPH